MSGKMISPYSKLHVRCTNCKQVNVSICVWLYCKPCLVILELLPAGQVYIPDKIIVWKLVRQVKDYKNKNDVPEMMTAYVEHDLDL